MSYISLEELTKALEIQILLDPSPSKIAVRALETAKLALQMGHDTEYARIVVKAALTIPAPITKGDLV